MGVWMAATDTGGILRTAAHHVFLNLHEFWSGPLELQNEVPAPQANWNKVYPVTALEIQHHRNMAGQSGYTPGQNISNWPGSAGFPFANVLAPFVDVQANDMVYSPVQGDYPYIAGDAAVYAISNDRYSTHAYTSGEPLGVELHTFVQGFQGDSALNGALLLRYSVFNRSGRDYMDFRFSPVIDFQIGDFDNDFLGTEAVASALYCVNDTSEATFSGRMLSFVCMALNRPLSSTMYFEQTNDPINGQPDSAIHFYRLMQGIWKNGKPLNYGSNGVDGSGSASFVYPDTTDFVNGGGLRWRDQVPGKKTGLMNFAPRTLAAGTAVNYELALFYVDENVYNFKQIGQKCLMIKQALTAKNALKNASFTEKQKSVFKLFPNPVRPGEKLGIDCGSEIVQGIRIVDMHGREIDDLDLDIHSENIILPPDLKPGVYTVEIETLNTVMYSQLILSH